VKVARIAVAIALAYPRGVMPRVHLVCLILAVATTARADDERYIPPDLLAATPPLPASLSGRDVWRLDLRETHRIAVRNNLEVVLEREQVKVAGEGVTVARGAFEPVVAAGYAHGDLRTPPASIQEGAAGEIVTFIDDTWRLSLVQRLATGTRMAVDFSNGRAKSTLGTAVQPLNYRSTLSLTISHPLLRGFSRDLVIPELEVLRARIGSERQQQQLQVAVTAVVERAEAAYWGVLLALYRHELAARSHRAADDQLQLTRRQIAAGILPPSDLISAESTLAQRTLELVQAEQTIEEVTDQLRAVLNLPRDQWARPILPVDVPRFAPGTVSADAALELAIANRPELVALALDQRDAELVLRKAENDKLPQLDLGLTGTLFGQDDVYVGALSQLSSTDARGWTVLLNLTWTPLNRTASAVVRIAEVQTVQTRLRREQALQAVWLDVRQAVRDQGGAERRVRAAARFRQLAEESLEIEQRRFLNGDSQHLFIAQRQEAVLAAQLAEVDALLGHVRATTALHRATGRLLPERRIELAR
jgi:outer membrane protein